MDSGEALLAFHTSEYGTFVWAVPKEGAVAFAATDLDTGALQDIVSRLRDALAPDIASLADIPDFDVGAAYNLFDRLLRPVEAVWDDAKTLIVVADGALGQLPLSVLPTDSTGLPISESLVFDEYRSIKWLARHHAVAVLPSIASLTSLRDRRDIEIGRQPFIGFGDPWFSVEQVTGAETNAKAQVRRRKGFDGSGMELMLKARPNTRAVDSADLAGC